MLKVGVTGGIGSGKSLVCKLFEQLGVPVYYADQAATEIFYQTEIQQQLVKTFGKEIQDTTGRVDRKMLADLVFADTNLLDKLNAIIHPAVALDVEKWNKHHAATPYVLKEAAILFESGTNKGLHKVVTVVAPVELRIARIEKSRGLLREEIESRMNTQLSDEEKMKRSDFVIYNDEQQLLIPQVLAIHQQLLAIK